MRSTGGRPRGSSFRSEPARRPLDAFQAHRWLEYQTGRRIGYVTVPVRLEQAAPRHRIGIDRSVDAVTGLPADSDADPTGLAGPSLFHSRSSGIEWQVVQDLQIPFHVRGQFQV